MAPAARLAAGVRIGGAILVAPLTLWLAAAFALPLGVVVLLSLQAGGGPRAALSLIPSLAQFREALGDAYTRRLLADSVGLSVAVTLASALLAYPMAIWLAALPPRWRPLGQCVILVPLLTNVVVRSLGVMLLLGPGGVVAGALRLAGLGSPTLLFGWFAVGFGLTQVFLPFMILALMDSVRGLDSRLDEASASLGAGPARRFLAVTLPLSLPGLRAGAMTVFLLASTAFVSPTILGGRKVQVLPMEIYQEALQNLDYPAASALAVALTVVTLAVAALIGAAIGAAMPWADQRGRRRPTLPDRIRRPIDRALEATGPWIGRTLGLLCFLVLIFPLLLVVVSSVNDSPQATVSAFLGFTWKWYGLVFASREYIDAFLLSLEVAAASVAAVLAIALPAAFAIARWLVPRPDLLHTLFLLPLALPGLAIGVGMLRLLQWFAAIPPFLGLVAVHVVLAAPFALSLLRASVARLDRDLEHASRSLGAGWIRCFLLVILPQLAPGLTAAGIIAFLTSFGEVTVTAFLTTARNQTLPVRMYADATFSLENTVNALSTLIIAVTVALLLTVNRLVRLDRLR